MSDVRWYKVLNDLWGNKTRTGLIVASISVGLFAIGTIINARTVLSQGFAASYAAINPSSGTVRTIETFDEDFVRSIRHMRDVQEADARTVLSLRFQVKTNGTRKPPKPAVQDVPGRWRDLLIFAVPDYEDMRVNKIQPQSGAWPPPPRELLLERSAIELVGAQVGDSILIETPDRKLRELRIAGLVRDLCQVPAMFDGMPRGYVAYATLDWLGEPRGLNELHIVARNQDDAGAVLRTLNRVKDRLEKDGFSIPLSTYAEPGTVPLDDILQTVLLLLGVLGMLSLFLSVFLIINAVSALVTQQTRQVGIMKAVGARNRQIVAMYLVLVLAYGCLALLLAVPLGAIGAHVLSQLMAGLFNFDLPKFYVAPQAVGLQVAIGLLVPLLSGLYPILNVLRVTAAAAMKTYGLARDQFGAGWLDRLMAGQGAFTMRFLSRPTRLSLRNTFRRKGRLALTLTTLTLGGAIFMGIFSMRASVARTLNDVTQIYASDIWVNFDQPERVERVERETLEVPGVTDSRGWTRMPVRRIRDDDSESEPLILYAPPIEANLVRPTILEGRWLVPEDRHALVVSTGALNKEPDLGLGDQVLIKVEGRETAFRVVGVALGFGLAPMIYASYDDVARITHDVKHTGSLMVVTQDRDPAVQAQVAAALEAHLKRAGMRVSAIQLVSEETAGTEAGFGIVILLALVMAFLLAAVGGLGLMGTLSMNVLERTREIGVMRAIGADNRAIAQVFIVEGILIGALSWLLGVVVAIPLSGLLSHAVGMAFLQAPLSQAFSITGVAGWLALVVVLSGLASFVPARNASRLTVREVLAYE
jgi:putative ABC transport system permease protein